MQDLFQDDNIDPKDLSEMAYSQKRMLVLKSSKALVQLEDDDSDEDNPEPAVLALSLPGSSRLERQPLVCGLFFKAVAPPAFLFFICESSIFLQDPFLLLCS